MKSIEEAAKDFSEDIRENSLSGNNIGKEQYKSGRKIGFKSGVEFAQRWIPVEEELPEENEVVLYKSNGNVNIGTVGYGRFSYLSKFVAVTGITHWRPIELK